MSNPHFSGVRHIIFDLGGVLLNLNYLATEAAFIALGATEIKQHFSQLEQSDFFNLWEKGALTKQQFFDGIRAFANIEASDTEIAHAWNAMLLDFPLRRLQLLQQLQLHFDLFLLSNTNEIHLEAFNQILKETVGVPSLAHFFDKVYYSHQMGMRKPDAEIFLKVLNDNGLTPEKTLFLDDNPHNIAAANRLGIKTLLVTNSFGMEQIFRQKTG
ncbi:MAG: HAD family phosphatase [Bacteroidetes bacterium]|nr:HAD family phosphatase [Bacteroidota bacterium]